MENFIENLNHYWSTHEAVEEDGGLLFFDEYSDEEGHDLMTEVWNSEAVNALRQNGYSTRTFERDSFGVLVAGIGKDGKWLSIG